MTECIQADAAIPRNSQAYYIYFIISNFIYTNYLASFQYCITSINFYTERIQAHTTPLPAGTALTRLTLYLDTVQCFRLFKNKSKRVLYEGKYSNLF